VGMIPQKALSFSHGPKYQILGPAFLLINFKGLRPLKLKMGLSLCFCIPDLPTIVYQQGKMMKKIRGMSCQRRRWSSLLQTKLDISQRVIVVVGCHVHSLCLRCKSDAAGPVGDEWIKLEWGTLTPCRYAIWSSEMSRLVKGYVVDVLGWALDQINMVQALPDDYLQKWDLLTMYGHDVGGAAPC
jgi:hypothetical protein